MKIERVPLQRAQRPDSRPAGAAEEAPWCRPGSFRQVAPVYPPLALQARVQGTVRFEATIDRQGRVSNLQVQSGHPLLIQAAMEAANQWVFEPTALNGQAVEVISRLDVNFVLPNWGERTPGFQVRYKKY